MIYLIVSVRIKAGRLEEFFEVSRPHRDRVRQEKGCIQYTPLIDLDTGSEVQTIDRNVVTVLEQWESIEAFQSHLAAPELADQMEKEKDLVEEMSVKVLTEP